MSSIQSSVIAHQDKVASDMSTIIGRYKGSMEVYAEKIRDIVKNEKLSSHAKFKLELLAESMANCVYHNEQLWKKRGMREATDTVQLERA